jgi:hypothetical protein
MRSVVHRSLLVSILTGAVAMSSACDNNSNNDSTSTTPTAFQVTETFNGTLVRNGAASYSFTVQSAGTITVTLTKVSDTVNPELPAPNIGISLGSWDGTACAIQYGIFTDSASQGAAINGVVQGAGILCARVYDPASFVTNPLSYTLTVLHP